MSTGSGVLIASLAALIALSAFFSASETSYSALNHIRIKSLADGGDKRAQRVQKLAADYDKLLSSILIGNNIVNILASSLGTVLFVGWFGNLGVTLSTVVVTVLVLLFGEISPKTLAKEAPERFAMAVAAPLEVALVVFKPLNYLFSAWKRLLLKLFKVQGGRSATEQELLTYVGEVRAEGGINADDEQNIRRAIAFDDLQAGDIYTHRVDVVAVEQHTGAQEIAALFQRSGYTRLPVYNESLDDVVGLILDSDFVARVVRGGQPLPSIIRPVLFVAATARIAKLLDEMQQKRIHMAVVVDEYGGMMGILTVEDIVEEMMGEIWDEHEQARELIAPLGDGSYRVLGQTPVKELFALFGVTSKVSSRSVGGWTFEVLGRFPAVGEQFTEAGLQVQVEQMDGHRVEEVTVCAAE